MTRTKISAIAFAFSAVFAGHAMAADNGPATRAQVQAELAEAVRTDNVVRGENGVKLNDIVPHNYPESQNVVSKTREEVRAELAEAVRNGMLDQPIEA